MKIRSFSSAILIFLLFIFSPLLSVEYVTRIYGEKPGDRFGAKIAFLGDINKDGFGDFAVGAPGKPQDKDYSGMVYIYFGGTSGFKNPFVLRGENPGDRFGIAIAGLGDIDKDGYDDFAVGADRNDGNGTDAGKVYIFKGGSKIDSIPYKTIVGERSNDWFGFVLAGGKDINGDGEPDLLVGAPYGGKSFAGALYIFLSGAFEKPALVVEGESGGDMFGSSVSIDCDINGDGVNDILVGAYYSTHKGKSMVGKAYIYYGGSIIAPNPSYIISGENERSWFGFSVLGVRDINGDGASEILISAPRDKDGKVFVYSYKDLSKPFIVLAGSSQSELFGYSISVAGDVNGDGVSDIIVGSPANSDYGYRFGKAYIFYTGVSMDGKFDAHFSGSFSGEELGYSFGFVESFGGKGKNLFLIGSPAPEVTQKGSVQVFR